MQPPDARSHIRGLTTVRSLRSTASCCSSTIICGPGYNCFIIIYVIMSLLFINIDLNELVLHTYHNIKNLEV